MGYTHSYGFKKGFIPTDEDFANAVYLFKSCLKGTDVILRNGVGEGEPTICDDKVCFNGDASTDDDYETFAIFKKEDYNGEPTQREFTKTARRPYDIACCLCLLSFKEIFGDNFEFGSDGTMREDIVNPSDYMKKFSKERNYTYKIEDEWQAAYDIFDVVVGKELDYPREFKA